MSLILSGTSYYVNDVLLERVYLFRRIIVWFFNIVYRVHPIAHCYRVFAVINFDIKYLFCYALDTLIVLKRMWNW